jgi:hypothetical protein
MINSGFYSKMLLMSFLEIPHDGQMLAVVLLGLTGMFGIEAGDQCRAVIFQVLVT